MKWSSNWWSGEKRIYSIGRETEKGEFPMGSNFFKCSEAYVQAVTFFGIVKLKTVIDYLQKKLHLCCLGVKRGAGFGSFVVWSHLTIICATTNTILHKMQSGVWSDSPENQTTERRMLSIVNWFITSGGGESSLSVLSNQTTQQQTNAV